MNTREESKSKAVRACTDLYLYQSLEKAEKDETSFQLRNADDLFFDSYCIYCRRESTFKVARHGDTDNALGYARSCKLLRDDTIPIIFVCQRIEAHKYFYIFREFVKGIQKIGQHPSVEDIASSELDRFRSVLDKPDYAELHRAGGLASHGVGIGAFVYLRRIFERLITRHYAQFSLANGPIEKFETLRMQDKIERLASVLPSVLVANAKIYSILSVGIHELSEEMCKKYFPIVRGAIIAILEEDLQNLQKARAVKELSDSLAGILGEIASQDAATPNVPDSSPQSSA